MQTARQNNLSPLNIELALTNKRPTSSTPVQQHHKLGNIESTSSSSVVEPNPLSPLSPPTFSLHASPFLASCSTSSEVLILCDRYLLLDFIESGVSPQSQPQRRCVDIVTEEIFFCRECSRSPSTSLLLEAHRRLSGSEAVTPIRQAIEAVQGDAKAGTKLYLLSPASYGDLHSYLRTKRRLKESEARSLFRQAAQAVYDCHSNGVVLTDLKLRRFVFADPQRWANTTQRGPIFLVVSKWDKASHGNTSRCNCCVQCRVLSQRRKLFHTLAITPAILRVAWTNSLE